MALWASPQNLHAKTFGAASGRRTPANDTAGWSCGCRLWLWQRNRWRLTHQLWIDLAQHRLCNMLMASIFTQPKTNPTSCNCFALSFTCCCSSKVFFLTEKNLSPNSASQLSKINKSKKHGQRLCSCSIEEIFTGHRQLLRYACTLYIYVTKHDSSTQTNSANTM
jgi:hypothetical protein